jgi:Putative DNA-binding domain
MNGVNDLIESLLYQGEGESLDFKRDQYPFSGADDLQKSEILKDLLAFANSWRRADAYILIGVKAEIGQRHTVVGTEEHFDDAQLQQFINSKTNRKIIFSYNVYAFEEKMIGIIHIPIQERPTYANRDFGKVKKEFVYYRLGSSTAIAKPEEIAKMGKDSHIQFLPSKPVISLEYANLNLRKSLGREIILHCLAFKEPSSRLPSLQKPNSHNSYSNFSISMSDPFERFNPDYWREYEAYIRSLALVQQIGFVLHNQSNFLAQNVRIEIHGNAEQNITIFDLDSVPDRPVKTEMEKVSRGIKSIHAKKIQTIINSYGSKWMISANIGNIQPQQKAWAEEPFFIGCTAPSSLKMEVLIYADNLPEPQKEHLVIQFEVQDEAALNINTLEFFQTSHNFIEDNLNFHRNRT